MMKIQLASLLVNDPQSALRFYTEVLGFLKKTEISEIGWITVVSPETPEGVELLLEPTGHEASKVFQRALYEDGIPLTAFAVDDIHAEYEKLSAKDVQFKVAPTPAGPATIAIFDDTCGNLIQIYQVTA